MFHESDICTNSTKLNFQRWKYVKLFVVHGFFCSNGLRLRTIQVTETNELKKDIKYVNTRSVLGSHCC